MSVRRIAALLAGLLLAAMFANAASRNNNIRIKVLDSETQAQAAGDNGVPNNCDQLTFDAYCRSGRSAPVVSTLLVQEADGPPFRITCTIESRFSKCTPLPVGESFEAKRGKHGITVYYVDENGKLRSQLYKLVPGNGRTVATATPAGPATVTPPTKAPAAVRATPAPAAAPVATPATPAPAPTAAADAGVVGEVTAGSKPATVKCEFSSTPAGAEVTVDGRYVGSTPSVLGLTTGTHVVVVSMSGFAQWKRQLDVTSGSELTINAVLQKTQ